VKERRDSREDPWLFILSERVLVTSRLDTTGSRVLDSFDFTDRMPRTQGARREIDNAASELVVVAVVATRVLVVAVVARLSKPNDEARGVRPALGGLVVKECCAARAAAFGVVGEEERRGQALANQHDVYAR
jgi:hypothetical protein